MRHRTSLVIGGSGFLGHHLCAALNRKSQHVIVIDDQRAADPLNLRGTKSQLIEEPFENCALGMLHAWKEIEAIYFLAAESLRTHLFTSNVKALNADLVGYAGLLDGLVRMKWAGRLVYISSSEVYGSAEPPNGDNGPFQPLTPYAASKFAAECLTMHAARVEGLDAVVIRPFNLYGPFAHYEGLRGEVIPRFMIQARLGRSLSVQGNASRDFLWVEDAVAGILMIQEKGLNQTYALGSGMSTTIVELANVINRLGNARGALDNLPRRPGDTPALECADHIAAHDLGWVCRMSLKEGLENLWSWYELLGQPMVKAMAALMPTEAWQGGLK